MFFYFPKIKTFFLLSGQVENKWKVLNRVTEILYCVCYLSLGKKQGFPKAEGVTEAQYWDQVKNFCSILIPYYFHVYFRLLTARGQEGNLSLCNCQKWLQFSHVVHKIKTTHKQRQRWGETQPKASLHWLLGFPCLSSPQGRGACLLWTFSKEGCSWRQEGQCDLSISLSARASA